MVTMNITKKRGFVRLMQSFVIFGILIVTAMGHAVTDTAQTTRMPWSGYWWPTTSGGLANGYGNFGHPAPIEKYELYTRGAYPGDATRWELENFFDPTAPSWYGQCTAWAAAAAFEAIDFYPSVINQIVFRVGDKKGLITSCHWDDPAIRMSGVGSPHVFHEWLLYYIKEQGKAFVADLGGPTEAWFYPIFKYEMTVSQSGTVAHVECRVWYADDHVHPDYQGTKVQASITYYYDLYLNGNGEIIGGKWTGGSVNNHPKSFFFPLSAQPKSPYLDYQTIRRIAVHKDDDIESDQPVMLSPGTHPLILLNRDVYTLPCIRNDTLSLTVQRLDELDNQVTVNIVDAMGALVSKIDITGAGAEYSFTADTPPYSLVVESDDYSSGNIYQIVFDLHREGEEVFPEIQKGGGWNGFSLTNAGTETCKNTMIIAYDQNNRPVMTAYGPEDIAPFTKTSFCLSGLSIPAYQEKNVFFVKLLSESPVTSLFLSGVIDSSMSGVGVRDQSSRLVLPDTTTMYNVQKYVSWNLHNAFVNPLPVKLSLYDAQGSLKKQISMALAGFDLEKYTPSSNPFGLQIDNGWVLVESDAGQPFNGFIKWHKDGTDIAEALTGLTDFGTLFYLPHLATGGLWNTELTLINLSDEGDTTVSLIFVHPTLGETAALSLLPKEKRIVSVPDLFPALSLQTISGGALLIQTDTEITGYFSYKINSSKASFGLMPETALRTQMVLPHVASNSHWWTGVALFNPSDGALSATLMPYDIDGKVISQQIKSLVIPPLSKKVFCIKNVFDADSVQKLSWVKVQTDGEGAMGLVLYGDTAFHVLSGSALYPGN